jgi:2-iminobutanoate/2-iminopropanoate deaminase
MYLASVSGSWLRDRGLVVFAAQSNSSRFIMPRCMLLPRRGTAMQNLLGFAIAAALIATTTSKEAVSTKEAPLAAGPYSQGIKAGGFVFAAGQIGRDPVTNKVEGDVKAQTERTLKNLSAVLAAAGASMDRAVKVTVFLKNISDFQAMNEVYAKFFPGLPSAQHGPGHSAE